jgi:DNA replication protein DnaC
MEQSAILKAMLDMGMEPGQAGQTIAEMAMITATSKSSDANVCAVCGGDGWILHEADGYRSSEKCQCRLAQEAERRIRNSGLSLVLDGWTFDAFKDEQPYQKTMKETALRYTKTILDGGNAWLYMGGQVGSGKSHLCTAVCGELLRTKYPVKYMRWVTDSGNLKGYVTDREAFSDAMEYKEAKVLYVDDLFKMQHWPGKRPRPTDADIRVAFELFDYRYAERKPTIITSEWMLSTELMDIDAGTFSRMYEMSKGYLVEIAPGKGKNWRTNA